MKRRIIYLSVLLVLAILVAMAFNLPGIAIAKFTSAAGSGDSLQSQVRGIILIGKEYSLILQPVPPGSYNSTVFSNTLAAGSFPQASGQTVRNALRGGSYILSQPRTLDYLSGCCCMNYLPCVRK